ncbi:MAG TPA: hypothetical protein VFT79_03035 [Solirubrobacterales bacterium]|nr:hypothetical protein [Solirubrobacterales bacterium]
MAEHRQIPEPGETIYTPAPSWAPVFFAIGILGLVAGTFASGFMFPPYIYALVGAIVLLLAFRSIVRDSVRNYYRLPRRQEVRGAALPVETISGPPQS